MKHILTTIIFLGVIMATRAQNLHVTVFGGFSNYQGDLQNKRFTLDQSHPAFGAGLLYEISDNLYARANVTFGKVSGDDKSNSKNDYDDGHKAKAVEPEVIVPSQEKEKQLDALAGEVKKVNLKKVR